MPENPQPSPRRGHPAVTVSSELDDAIRHCIDPDPELRPGEVVTAYTLILHTRYIDPSTGKERTRRLRIVPDGVDPHLSLGLLDAATERLRTEIA